MNALVQAKITTPGNSAHSFRRNWMDALVQAKITTPGNSAHSFLRDWMNALVQAKITMPGIARSFLRAVHVAHTKRAHEVTAAALYILQHRAYDHYCLQAVDNAESA